MYTDVHSYVKVYKQNVDKEICQKALEQLDKGEWHQHKFYDPTNNTYYTNEKEPDAQFGDFDSYNDLCQVHHETVGKYVEDLNYHWFSHWLGMSNPKFNRYTTGQAMTFHADHIREIFDGNLRGIPLLSVLSVIENTAQGGEFVVCSKEYNLQQGDTIIFPSNFMFPHAVKNTTSGSRISAINWVF